MSAAKQLARLALHRGGGLAALRRWNRGGFRILTYHAFPADSLSSLDWQCRHLRRYYQPVTMSAVAESLEGGKPLPDYALAVTVDDGNADFRRAQPIFQKYGIPVLVYLASDFLDRQLWFWWNQILYACRHTSRTEMEVALAADAAARRFSLRSDIERQETADSLIEAAKSMPNRRRLALCEEVLERLQVRLPAELPEEWRPLRWDEVRQLRHAGVEFGVHTKTHPILSTLEDDESVREEIRGSKERIEAELNTPAIHFCYPNGRLKDMDRRTDEAVRGCGFRTAVTMIGGVNFAADPFLLRRFGVDPSLPSFYFAELVSGLHHLRNTRQALARPGDAF